MVTISKILHKGEPRIKIEAPNSPEYNTKIRQVPGRTFSASLQCWHVPDNEVSRKMLGQLFDAVCPNEKATPDLPSPAIQENLLKQCNPATQNDSLKGIKLVINDKWIEIYMPAKNDDITMLKQIKYCHWNKHASAWMVPMFQNNLANIRNYFGARIVSFTVLENKMEIVSAEKQRQPGIIFPVNTPYLAMAKEEMILKGMSKSTLRTYLGEMSRFLADIKEIPAIDFTHDRLRKYLTWCVEEVGLSENTIHSRMNAMKFFYEQVLKREKFFFDIPRPKKPFLLPKLLNEDELGRLFAALENKKHKAILFTVYSSGLRVSEVCALKIANIDSGRMQIHIEGAKGKKDRYVNLSPLLLDILRQYIKTWQPKPKVYLFESDQTGTAYPTRTVQQIFANAKARARILKEVGIHSLRHSFATHLLDKGTDIRYIKDLLGHFNIKTTERYLHVSKQQLVNIISPLDDLYKKGKINLNGDEEKYK